MVLVLELIRVSLDSSTMPGELPFLVVGSGREMAKHVEGSALLSKEEDGWSGA